MQMKWTIAGSAPRSKKKGLFLDPDQVCALSAITGVIKILTVNAACAFRLARTGCLPYLLLLKDHSSLPLRRNCEMILRNVAFLEENESVMAQLDVPEEYTMAHHNRLTEDEAAAVGIDFSEVSHKGAQLQLKIHGHLFNMRSDEAQKFAEQAQTFAEA